MTLTALTNQTQRPPVPPTPTSKGRSAARVRPSKVDPTTARPFTLDQELKPFGRWVDNPIWVPPKDASKEMAESMLNQPGWFKSLPDRWQTVVKDHRDQFTQVREMELPKASIRLPKGKLFVKITEQQDFDTIKDSVPACVQTRLDEFLEGPGQKRGVKVRYLKPLCIEMDSQLHFTSREDVLGAIEKIQAEVFSQYHRMYFSRRTKQALISSVNLGLAIPREIVQFAIKRQQKAIDAYQAKLEFERRKTALRAMNQHKEIRTHGCTFDEMLALTNPLDRRDVVSQFSAEQELSLAKKKQLMQMAVGQLPWFAAFSMGLTAIATVAFVAMTPVVVCDPAFVAEFPDSPGVLWNIGHFDEIDGIRHVEI